MQTLLNYFYRYFLLQRNKNVFLRGKVHVKNRPIVDVCESGSLEIGNNVTLNSKNQKYHINMFAPVKIYIDRKDARIKIGDNTRIHGSCLHAYQYIEIGSNCLIAANCQIFDSNGHDIYLQHPKERINTQGTSEPITIGNNCWIGAHCIILPGTKLGDNCIVSAGSIVKGVFQANSLIATSFATTIKNLS